MTNAFDNLGGLRLLRVGILINGAFQYFENLDIRVQGSLFFSPTNDFCVVKISNLTTAQFNDLITKTSPTVVTGQNFTPTALTIDAGRKNKGYYRLYEGIVYTSGITPPPDEGIVLRSTAGSGLASVLLGVSLNSIASLDTVAQEVAAKTGLILDNTAKPKNIANYQFIGNANQQALKLQEVGNVRVTILNGKLIIRDLDGHNKDVGFVLSAETGMVGVPQATESGCTAKMLANPIVECGDRITVNSKINTKVNNTQYIVSQLNFDLANRDNPYFYELVLTNEALMAGST